MNDPKQKKYSKKGKYHKDIEVEVDIAEFGFIADGTLKELYIGDKNGIYFEDNPLIIDLDISRNPVYGYKKEDGKNILEISVFAANGDSIGVVVEDSHKEVENLATMLFLYISPKNFEIYSYGFEEEEK